MAAALSVAVPCFAHGGHGEIRGGSIVLHHQSEAAFPALAKISIEQALSIGLKAVNGKPIEVELENEDGFLMYEVEVVRPDNVIMEVMVDAGTGKVLAIENEKDAKD
jgi:uncharacterized membrane protein YkoI